MSHRRPFNVYRDFDDFSADVDLTDQAGVVAIPATRLLATNLGDTDQTLVIKGPDGEDVTFDVPANDKIELNDLEVYSIDSTTDADRVVAFWMDEGQRKNPA